MVPEALITARAGNIANRNPIVKNAAAIIFDTQVSDEAQVYDDAQVYGEARVFKADQ